MAGGAAGWLSVACGRVAGGAAGWLSVACGRRPGAPAVGWRWRAPGDRLWGLRGLRAPAPGCGAGLKIARARSGQPW
ncbi:MAG TPA: hypothetical protein VH478_07570, partial [Trebonia sp.]|nr:hypothetical protein [Trebonia sp.]